MNTIEASVTKVLKPPYARHGRWWVTVEVESYGVHSETDQMFNTKADAEALKVGDTVEI